MELDLATVDALLSTTRSVRKRLDLDRPVELDTILECLRLAVQAPTASNSQGWRWIVVTDAAKRAELARIYEGRIGGYLRKAAVDPDRDAQTRRVYESALHLSSVLARVPVHVIACVQERGADSTPAALYGSIIPATWSFMLALRSRGLGSVWTTAHLHRQEEVAALLDIPDDFIQVALLPVAYTLGTDFKPAARPPVEEVTYVDTWGRSPDAPSA